MSRYFQQLARHAGLASSAPVSAGLPANATPAVPHADIAEEIVERDAVSTQSGVTAASPLPSVQSVPNPPAEASLTAHAQASEKIPAPAIPGKNSPPARSIPAGRTAKNTETPGRQPVVAKPPAAPDAATVIQQVIAWVAEPERARTAPSAAPVPTLPAGKNVSASVPPAAPAANVLPVASQPATVKIMPASRKDATRPSPAPEPDKKSPRTSQDSSPARLEVMASPVVSPRSRLASPAGAPSPRREDPAREFHVSIGSIHLTVEAPPPAAPPPRAPAPRPASAPSASARTGGLATSARRHYLRSFT